MKKLGLDSENTDDLKKITSLGSGGYMLKERAEAFETMLEEFDRDLQQLKADPVRLEEALIYELHNHEYCITGDPDDALQTLGFDGSEGIAPKILERACKAAA